MTTFSERNKLVPHEICLIIQLGRATPAIIDNPVDFRKVGLSVFLHRELNRKLE
jgi:hypothetical protein